MPNWLTDPLWKGPSRAARGMANTIDPPAGEGGYWRGLLAGSMEGAGDVMSDMTSPLSIASTLAGAGGARRLFGSLRGLRPATEAVETASPYADEGIDIAELYDRMGPEFVPIGGEDIINSLRNASRSRGPIPASRQMPISGSVDPADMMSRVRR